MVQHVIYISGVFLYCALHFLPEIENCLIKMVQRLSFLTHFRLLAEPCAIKKITSPTGHTGRLADYTLAEVKSSDLGEIDYQPFSKRRVKLR